MATGKVTFLDGSAILGTAWLGSTGLALFTTNNLSVGTHTITANYGGDNNFTGSGSENTLTQTITQASTTTTVSSPGNPSGSGQAVTFTALVMATAPSSGLPTGTVTFWDGTDSLGTGLLSAATATYTASALASGPHTITAVYGGDANFTLGTPATVTQTVLAASSTTLIALSAATVFGQTVTFMATVPDNGTSIPTGWVTFLDALTILGIAPLHGGTATCSTTNLGGGTGLYSVTAIYGGDGSYASSTSAPAPQTVNRANTANDLDLFRFVRPVRPVCHLHGHSQRQQSGSGTPGSVVTFLDGTTVIGVGWLDISGARRSPPMP